MLLFWGALLYTRADGAAQARGLEAAIYLLTTILSFPLSLLTVAGLNALEYPAVLVRIAIVLAPILNLALWGLIAGSLADTVIWFGSRYRAPPGPLVSLLGRRNVLRGWSTSFAEEEIFHVFDDDLLRLERRGVEAVLVDDHLQMLSPHLPGIQRHVVVDPLS